VGQYDPSTVRVVLDVGTIGRVTSFELHDPERLIIDVIGDTKAADPPAPAPATPNLPKTTEGLPAPATGTEPPKADPPKTIPGAVTTGMALVKEARKTEPRPEPKVDVKTEENELKIIPASRQAMGIGLLYEALD
jgi:hypothetical protein